MTVADLVVSVVGGAHVRPVLQNEVVVSVVVGVGADAHHVVLVRRRYLDDARPRTVELDDQTEVGREPHVHSVVADLEAGVDGVGIDTHAVHLNSGVP